MNIFEVRPIMFQGIPVESKTNLSEQKEDRRMKFLTDPSTEFQRGDDGIWIAYNTNKKISMQISEQLFRQINDKPLPYKPIYSLRSGSIRDDLRELDEYEKERERIRKENREAYKRAQAQRAQQAADKRKIQIEIKKDNIVRLKNETSLSELKKENAHFKEEVEFLGRVCNLMLIHNTVKIKQIFVCASVVERLAPGDAEELAVLATNFKILEEKDAVPTKFQYKNVIFCLNADVSNDEVFRFEFDE
jgi:hypothetical protein